MHPLAVRLCLAAMLLTGCHAVPQAITLPTTAAVRAPIAAAQGANARAVQIVTRARKSGLAAGSEDLQNLSADLNETRVQLTTAAARIDALSAQLLAAQRRVDAQTGDLTSLTGKYNAAVKSLWHYRLWFWGPLSLALAAVGIGLAARFTAWGAHTFGPYLLGAEHLAVRAAALV